MVHYGRRAHWGFDDTSESQPAAAADFGGRNGCSSADDCFKKASAECLAGDACSAFAYSTTNKMYLLRPRNLSLSLSLSLSLPLCMRAYVRMHVLVGKV